MLLSLTIQNIALIQREEIVFSDGLNVLSGETGAGKSIVLDAIDFVLGAKAERSMIRHGAQECSVLAVFSCDRESVRELLASLELAVEEQLIISRRFTAEGKSSIRLNGDPITLNTLRKITPLLVDMHGQSEHFYLLNNANQLAMLDRTAGEQLLAPKRQLEALLLQKKGILSDMQQIGGSEDERARRMDILRYQIDEITRGQLREGEEEELLGKKTVLEHAERIIERLEEAHAALRGEEGWGAIDAVTRAKRAMDAISKYDERCKAIADRLYDLLAELSDLEEESSSLLDGSEFDEAQLERIQNRLDEIRSLKKKYGGSTQAALQFLQQASAEYDKLVHGEELLVLLGKQLTACEQEIYSACLAISQLRKQTAIAFSKAVTEELKGLNIASARFEIGFSDFGRDDVARATANGLDEIEFLFSANAGEPLKALNKIISGGELSRFMLAVKAIGASETQTCIFDEIDAGIGGRTAVSVAEKFAKIALHTQVIAVSHLAQVVAFADHHLLIAKQEKDGATQTHVIPIEGDQRTHELARTIAGNTGELSLRQAEELLRQAQDLKKALT